MTWQNRTPRTQVPQTSTLESVSDVDPVYQRGGPRNNGRVKYHVADHPEWSAYLADRHILEPAIAVGVWIEYSDYYGRNCLVWHEKRRDDSRGASNVPKDIALLFNELGVTRFVYFADNDKAGERGTSNLRTLLHGSDWTGEGEYCKFAGPGIPEKGDANDLLCHHFPDISRARAALAALPRFEPSLKRKTAAKPASAIDDNEEGWDAVKEAIRIALDVEVFNTKGFSKNFRCLNPHHEDKTPSAAWHKDGFYKCFGCGEKLNAKQMAERLNIDWPLDQIPATDCLARAIDLDAAPQTDATAAPLSFEHAPDSWQRASNKFYTQNRGGTFPRRPNCSVPCR